jgi:hypothetical protein
MKRLLDLLLSLLAAAVLLLPIALIAIAEWNWTPNTCGGSRWASICISSGALS